MHLTISLKILLERWSANVAAGTFHLNRENSISAAPKHRRQPTRFIDRH